VKKKEERLKRKEQEKEEREVCKCRYFSHYNSTVNQVKLISEVKNSCLIPLVGLCVVNIFSSFF